MTWHKHRRLYLIGQVEAVAHSRGEVVGAVSGVRKRQLLRDASHQSIHLELEAGMAIITARENKERS